MSEQNLIFARNFELLNSISVARYNEISNENRYLKRECDRYYSEVRYLKEDNNNLKKRLRDGCEKDDEKIPKVSKTYNFKIIMYRKNKNSYTDQEINNLLKSIKSIKDIINLDNKWHSIKHNIILQRLYRLIKPLKELDKMIGLNEVKKNVFKKIIYYVRNPDNNEYLHTVISGPPGVGKTEVAKIYAKVFLHMGILKNESFIEAKRDDFVGKYLGQTAPKTRKLLESASGGVLFIDEAYSLGNEEKRDSYSKEAIDMINQYLSERKNEFMMIVAGYDKELDRCFFSYNPGLRRRFSSYFKIEKYNYEELMKIFCNKISSTKYFNRISSEKLHDFFKINYDEFKYYGGDIEKLISEIKYSQSFRTFNENLESNHILYDDLMDGFKNFKSNKKDEKKSEPPMGLYI